MLFWSGLGNNITRLGSGKYPDITSEISTKAADKHPDLSLRKYIFVATNTAGTNPQVLSKTSSFVAANLAENIQTISSNISGFAANNTAGKYSEVSILMELIRLENILRCGQKLLVLLLLTRLKNISSHQTCPVVWHTYKCWNTILNSGLWLVSLLILLLRHHIWLVL